ncbi:MAG TPA: hypothetical protein VF666_06865 [Pyrinomonadaceae bacterium]
MASPQFERDDISPGFYRIAERLLSIQATDGWASRVVESFIGGFYFTHSSNETGIIDGDIKIRTDEPPPVPSGLQSFEVPHGLCYTDGENYFLDVDDSRIAVGTLESKQINVWLGATPHARHPTALVNTLAYMLQAALRRCALYDLHAAGAVEPQSGVGVLFPATANSGKSSLTIRLAKSGWRYMSDDMLVLNELTVGVEARGLRRLFSVSDGSLAGCNLPRLDEALGTPVASDPSKRRLDPTIVFPGARAEACIPRVLCFPFVTGETESRIEAISHTEAMARLIKLCPWSSYDVTAARGNLRVLGRLVSQTKSFVFRAGRDVLDDPGLPATLFTGRFVEQ